jgi:hypothetical protein
MLDMEPATLHVPTGGLAGLLLLKPPQTQATFLNEVLLQMWIGCETINDPS